MVRSAPTNGENGQDKTLFMCVCDTITWIGSSLNFMLLIWLGCSQIISIDFPNPDSTQESARKGEIIH